MIPKTTSRSKRKTQFFVPGIPQTKGNHTKGWHGAIYDRNPNLESWQKDIANIAKQAHEGPLICGPVALEAHFALPRPNYHYASDGQIKPKYRNVYPIAKRRNDIDKLQRALYDGISDVVIDDDSRIVEPRPKKYFADVQEVGSRRGPGVWMAIWEMEG